MTLDELVREYNINEGRDSLHNYSMYLTYAIRGLKEMNIDVSGAPTVTVLYPDDMGRAALPSDIIKVMRMGIKDGQGNFAEIYRNENIVIGADGSFACTSPDTVIVSTAAIATGATTADLSGHYRNGEQIGRFYGNEGGSIYGYRIDYARGEVQFSSNLNGGIILEYLSAPKKINGKYEIHPFLEEPIMAWIYYSRLRFKNHVSRFEKREAFRDYINKKHHAAYRFVTESSGSMINTSRKTFSQVSKW